MTRKKLFAFVSLFLLVVVGITFLVNWFVTSTIVVSSSPEAKIFIKEGDEKFQEIGTGKATFKTRKTGTVFVEARHDGLITQKSTQPLRRKTINLALEVKQSGTAELVASVGPFRYPFIDQGFIYGIASPTAAGSLNVAPLEGTNPDQYPSLPLLPILRQIAWHDVNNFVYVTATKGAGAVSTDPSLQQSGLPYIGVASPNTSTTALLSAEGLHLASGLDIKNARLISRADAGSWSYVFADDDFIFFGWTDYEFDAEHEEGIRVGQPEETPEGHFKVTGIVLSVFDHNGEEKAKFDLPVASRVLRVASINKSTVGILADKGAFYLLDLNTGDIEQKKFSFGDVQDLVSFQGKFLLLGSSGLWEYDVDEDSYYRVANYPEAQGYVPYSLNISGDALYFSTIAKEEKHRKTRPSTNSVFRILLSD